MSYCDPYVDRVSVDGVEGGTLTSTDNPWRRAWDPVVVHTLHPGVDTHWLHHAGAVLDATYRLPVGSGSGSELGTSTSSRAQSVQPPTPATSGSASTGPRAAGPLWIEYAEQ